MEPVANLADTGLKTRIDGDASPLSATHPATPPLRSRPASPVYWRVEGSLLELTTIRPIAFFTWNSQTYIARVVRRSLVLLMALLRPFLYAANRVAATRIVHAVLRGITRDRLDSLGEEEFEYKLKPLLKEEGLRHLKALQASGAEVVLVSQGLGPHHAPASAAPGRALDYRQPVRFPRWRGDWPAAEPGDPAAGIVCADSRSGAGRAAESGALGAGARLARPQGIGFGDCTGGAGGSAARAARLSISTKPGMRSGFRCGGRWRGKRVMLIGVTGFIGKVWLANTLMDLPEIGKLYLLIRRQKSSPAQKRFEKMMEESPVFDPLFEKYGDRLGALLAEKIEVVEGDVSQPGLGLDAETAARLRQDLDLIINSSGLTDFNPDLRDALAVNVDSTFHLIEFIRGSRSRGVAASFDLLCGRTARWARE